MVRRSLLFVPGNNERMIQKALSKEIQADCIILDLEDSVPPNEKERARSIVASVLAGYRRLKRQIYIRINQLDSVFLRMI
jgi:Citrate lyase beta subunit